MRVESTELEDYIRSTLGAIKKGVHHDRSFRVHGVIDFDLAVTNMKGGKGEIKIYVVTASREQKSERVSHIKFKVRPYADEKEIHPKK